MEDKKREIQSRLLNGKKRIEREEIIDVIKCICPGTSLRSAIEGIRKAKTGALIVAYNELIQGIFEGGFKINCKFTSQKLIELSKMDGAIILSKDLKRILYANVLLTPDNSIVSQETGTRHKAAERTAKQAETIVITISQRRDEIALFYKDIKYPIRDTNEIIGRATEMLQILEKHKEIFEKNKQGLDDEELKLKPSLSKALLLIQRAVIILKTSEILKKYVIELGVEGVIVKSRLKELLYKVEREVDGVIKDYSKLGFAKSKRILSLLSYDELLELENIRQCLGLLGESELIFPRGHRILEKKGLHEKDTGILIKNMKNLPAILEAKKENVSEIFGEEKANELLSKLNHA